jgi:hypothetical protein
MPKRGVTTVRQGGAMWTHVLLIRYLTCPMAFINNMMVIPVSTPKVMMDLF